MSQETTTLESLGGRFAQASRRRVEALLARHGNRLTPAEKASYESQLQAGGSFVALRRRLLDRLLRGAGLRRRPVRDWEGLTELHDLPRGPYNDRAVLEATLHRFSQSDSEWTRELLDLYARMDKLSADCKALLS
ncbi:MAG TPA: hypothetical protein DCQ83_08810 [Fibrobacteres bacterium]|nr:hypothetical protein [Fibrobacterota bacterium]